MTAHPPVLWRHDDRCAGATLDAWDAARRRPVVTLAGTVLWQAQCPTCGRWSVAKLLRGRARGDVLVRAAREIAAGAVGVRAPQRSDPLRALESVVPRWREGPVFR